jgi:hypothetical protein
MNKLLLPVFVTTPEGIRVGILEAGAAPHHQEQERDRQSPMDLGGEHRQDKARNDFKHEPPFIG